MLRNKLALGLALLLPVSALAYSPEQNPEQDNPEQGARKCDRNRPIDPRGAVERGADGDTFTVKTRDGSYKVRMIGIDTPETHYMGETQGEWGDKASDRLGELLPRGTQVRLELSPSVCDSYGRVLAHVFVGKSHVNRTMVEEGLAVNYCLFPSVAHCEELGALTTAAIEAQIGMFSDPNVELPYDFRRRISNRQPTSFVGSTLTKEVFRPGNQDRVPVGERIFFQNENVPPPYRVVD